MKYETIQRLEYNNYALTTAFRKLREAIDTVQEPEIYAATGETLLWVLTTSEWHKKHNSGYKVRMRNHEKGQILYGLLHAYNSMKHNMDFIKIHQIDGGFQFPIEFPLEILPITVRWVKAGENLEGDWPSQKNNYEKYIEGKEIIYTFELALEFLNEEYSKIIEG